ncbi:MAG TPA: FtsL-like putative cell division protein [Chryseolinea sp.]|nr:FtsL-like putative cell division protein [Chryseolinea sp.]
MTENKHKIKAAKKPFPGKGMFASLEQRLKLEYYFEDGFPVKYLPKILFVMTLGLIYISNTHYAEKTVRRISAMQAEVEDLRADYTTLKADLMFASKQSEVARKVNEMGLKESLKPPYKVVVEHK